MTAAQIKAMFALLTVLLFAMTSSLNASPIKQDKHERALGKLIEEKCQTEAAPILSFPDGFQSQTGFSYCETAFAINQTTHANSAYLFYRANNILGYGSSKETVRSINKFLMPSSDPYDHSLQNLRLRAKNSDAWALLELARLAYHDEIKPDISVLPKLGSTELMKLLFLDTAKFTEEVTDWVQFEAYLDTYLENVWQMSSEYTFYAASKLLAVLDEFDAQQDFLASTFEIPEHLCMKILAALSFTDAAEKDFVWLLRLRVWSPREVFQAQYLGYETSFVNQMPTGADYDYLYTLVELENALSRIRYFQGTPTPEKLDRIKYYEERFPAFRGRFAKFFPLTTQSGILDISGDDVAQVFLSALKNKDSDSLNNSFVNLLFADIRTISAFPHLREKSKYDYVRLIEPNTPYVARVLGEPIDPLEAFNLQYIAHEEFKQANKSLDDLAIAVSKFSRASCNIAFDLICRKKWADVDLSIPAIEGAAGGGCKIDNKLRSFVSKQASAGAIDYKVFYFCNIDQIADIFGQAADNIKGKLPEFMYGSGATAYTNALYSEELVMHGGLIATKIYSNSPNKKWVPTPSTFNELSRSSFPFAWAYFSALSKGPMPSVDESGPFGPYVNYSSLADIYTISGNYERALAAQIKSLEENIYLANEYPEDFLNTLLEHFTKTKHLMRLTNIPEPIIDAFIREKFVMVTSDLALIKFSDLQLGLFKSVSGKTVKGQVMGYLGLDRPAEFALVKDDFDLESSFSFVRAALTEKNFLGRSCNDKRVLKALYYPSDEAAHYDNMGSAVWFGSFSIGHEFLGFWHQCARLYMNNLATQKDIAEINRLYDRYISQNVPDYLNINFNFAEPRSIQIFSFWTKAAQLSGSINGLLMSVTAVDHIYRQLANSFVYNDSRSLRTNQKHLEQIIVDATFALSELKRDASVDEFAISYVSKKLDSLRISSKMILSSNQKRQRYLGLNQVKSTPDFEDLNRSLAEAHRFWPKAGYGLGVWLNDVDGQVKISNILHDGPAFGQGISKGDVLLSYDGKDLKQGDTVSTVIDWFIESNPDEVILSVQKPNGAKHSAKIKSVVNWFELGLENQIREELFLDINKKADNADGPISYVKKIALKGEVEKIGMHFFPYEAEAHLSWAQIHSKLDMPIYSLSYSDGDAVLDKIDTNGRVEAQNFKFDSNKIDQLIDLLVSGVELSENEVHAACEIFNSLAKTVDMAASGLVFVPSVNLFPIPAEIILGTYCSKVRTAVIQASDITGAINFSRHENNWEFPTTFVGVGNPSVSEIASENLVASFYRGAASDRTFEGIEENFQPLPDAEEELIDIAKIFDTKNLYLQGDASVLGGLEKASEYSNFGANVAIDIATHGVPVTVDGGIYMPSLLSVEEGRKELVSNSMVETASIPGSTIVLSACDTAAGTAEAKDLMFTGFVESFANAGSKLVVASLWPVESISSKIISTSFFQSWKRKNLITAISDAKFSIKERVRSLPFVYLIP